MSKGIIWVRKLPFAIWKGEARKALVSFRDEAAVEGLNFFKANFDRQSFLDDRLKFWEPRKNDKTPGRKILIGKGSGRLKRSLRKETTGMDIKWVSDVPYAKIHNEGGTIQATQSVRAHVRRVESRSNNKKVKYIEVNAKGESRIKVVKTAQGIAMVKAHTRQVNTQIPQRQFIGYSAALMEIIKKIYHRKMNKLFTGSEI